MNAYARFSILIVLFLANAWFWTWVASELGEKWDLAVGASGVFMGVWLAILGLAAFVSAMEDDK